MFNYSRNNYARDYSFVAHRALTTRKITTRLPMAQTKENK